MSAGLAQVMEGVAFVDVDRGRGGGRGVIGGVGRREGDRECLSRSRRQDRSRARRVGEGAGHGGGGVELVRAERGTVNDGGRIVPGNRGRRLGYRDRGHRVGRGEVPVAGIGAAHRVGRARYGEGGRVEGCGEGTVGVDRRRLRDAVEHDGDGLSPRNERAVGQCSRDGHAGGAVGDAPGRSGPRS